MPFELGGEGVLGESVLGEGVLGGGRLLSDRWDERA